MKQEIDNEQICSSFNRLYDNATNEFYVERELEEIYESDVEEINLDKECGWVDNGEWMK